VYYDIGNCCSSTSRIQVGGLSNFNNYSVWSYDALSSSGKQLYRDGVLLQNRTNTGTYSSHGSHTFKIGENYNGNIAEIIIFNEKVNSAQRIIIENYLETKYGLTSSANDMFDEDNPSNGNFDHDFAGIGRVNASNIHNDAQGTGIIRILNPSDLDDNEFLMWAHNGESEFALETTDIPSTLQARVKRVWRTSEVNSSGSPVDVGSIDFRWDLSNMGNVTASDLRLLIDSDNDGLFTDETPISGATDLGGNIYGFTSISTLTNNARFTIGTINIASTPLPIELLSFEANANEDKVDLKWITASELNNDYFTIERSTDAKNWEEAIITTGGGNSNQILEYFETDYAPLSGVSYYRLKQTDFNGDYTYSNIVPVKYDINNEEDGSINLFPSPVSIGGIVNIEFNNISESELLVVLRDIKGREFYSKVLVNIEDGKLIGVPVNREIPSGIYLITATSENQIYSQKLIIK